MHTRFERFFPIEPKRSQLLTQLWDIQLTNNFIPDDAVRTLAQEHDIAEIEIEGVISFYHFLQRKNTGKYSIYLNNSIISEMKGYDRIRESFERETGAAMNSVDRTGTFGLFTTPCIGLSDQEPSALINFYPFTNLNSLRIKEIISSLRQGKNPEDIYNVPDDHIQYLPPNDHTILFSPFVPGAALKTLTTLKPEDLIEQLRISGLAGRGGAFYPTWQKWEACRKQSAQTKFIICNADEGEPGTFKDRVLIHRESPSMIEGMIIAAFTVGAEYGIIYLRGEYRWLKKTIEEALGLYYEQGFLGRDIAGIKGFNFDIRIQMGAGAYVCGEETALIESLEGKRGEPRTKWYFPVERGYLQLPSVVNNVETFCSVARLLNLGLYEYLQRGVPGSIGTKLLSVSGDCRLPGIYEIEWGMTVAELLELCEASDPWFIQVSGPSGECISIKEKFRRISMLDLLARKDIRCGGSFMIFNHQRDLVKILLNFSEFYSHESCGICTPCRAGNIIIHKKLERLQNGLADHNDLVDLKNWGNLMKSTSRCGLGKTACNSIIFALDKFQDYFNSRFATGDGLNKIFDVEGAVAEYEKYNS